MRMQGLVVERKGMGNFDHGARLYLFSARPNFLRDAASHLYNLYTVTLFVR